MQGAPARKLSKLASTQRPLSWRPGGLSKAICILVLCTLLSGCSAVRLAYNQLDWLTVWYLNGYFSLDEAQEEKLGEIVSRNLEWHRYTQLPKYAEFSRALERETSGILTADILEQRYAQIIVLWDEIVVQVLPDIAEFFLMLNDDQVDEFIDNLEDNNQDLWEDYAGETAAGRLERRQKGAVKGFKRIIGRLTREQKALVYAYMANMHDVSEQWMSSRREWQLEFRKLIVDRPQEPEFSERFRLLMIDPNRSDTSEYRQLVDENRATTIAMIVELSAQLTDDQRERLSRRLLNFSRDFEILSAQQT